MGCRNAMGQKGESIAVRFLQEKGYHILERNYRNTFGEIDIVANDAGTLVFLEVKTRKNANFSLPAEAVTVRKQQKISRVAQAYLSQHDQHDSNARFDVVTILQPDTATPQIELIRDAFELSAGV